MGSAMDLDVGVAVGLAMDLDVGALVGAGVESPAAKAGMAKPKPTNESAASNER